jgi:tryptophanyl-tRNA synthetase
LLSLLSDEKEASEWAARYRHGGVGYGEVKKRIIELFEAQFGPARARRAELSERPDGVEDILGAGAERARREARETMRAVREACGLACGLSGRRAASDDRS